MFKKINNKIIFYLDRILLTKYKKYSLFFTAFLDSIIAILPTDLITIYYFIKNKNANPLLQSFFIAIASILGGSILYFSSLYLIELFPNILNQNYYLKIKNILTYSTSLQLLLLSFFVFSSTIPFTLFSILTGLFNINFFLIYLPSVFIGRFLRFFIISFLTNKYGEDILKYLKWNSFFNLLKFNLWKKIKYHIQYWYQKRKELKKLKLRDLKQAYIIAQIQLFTEKKENIFVNLNNFIFFHPIDRKSALDKLQKRTEKLKNYYKNKKISKIKIEELNKILPSITNIQVIKLKENTFLVWEGNGRVHALKNIFKNIEIEVVEYKLSKTGQKIILNLWEDLNK